MTAADTLSGHPSIVLAPGAAEEDRDGSDGGVGPDRLYCAPDRVEAGARLSHDLLASLNRAGTRSGVDVVVHNEELHPFLVSMRSDPANRVVYYSHGLSSQEHPGMHELGRLQRKVLATGVTALVASDQQAAELLRLRLSGPVFTAPPPLSLYAQRRPPRRAPPTVPLKIVAAGRLVPQKGFDLLLRALDGCADVVGECHLYAGHGQAEYARVCEELAARCRVPVHQRGWLPHEELVKVLPAYSALVMPSRFEPLGLLAAEAIGVGMPVAGSATGGLGEVVRAADGVLIPCGPDGPAPSAIADAIGRLPGMATRSPEQSLEQWSPRRYADALNAALEHESARS